MQNQTAIFWKVKRGKWYDENESEREVKIV
jgi:hypothetical protein